MIAAAWRSMTADTNEYITMAITDHLASYECKYICMAIVDRISVFMLHWDISITCQESAAHGLYTHYPDGLHSRDIAVYCIRKHQAQ